MASKKKAAKISGGNNIISRKAKASIDGENRQRKMKNNGEIMAKWQTSASWHQPRRESGGSIESGVMKILIVTKNNQQMAAWRRISENGVSWR